MQNILLLAFSIPVIKAVCRNLKFYLLLWESLFIIAYGPCSKQRRLIWSFIFLCFYYFFFYLDDQRSLQPGFLLYLFLVFVKFYWKKPLSVFFLAVVCINLFIHPFCPFIEKNKKIKVQCKLLVSSFDTLCKLLSTK